MIHLREGKLVIDNIGREIGISEIDAIAEHVRLRESDAFQRGVAAMREAAAQRLEGMDSYSADSYAKRIRALPDPEDKP